MKANQYIKIGIVAAICILIVLLAKCSVDGTYITKKLTFQQKWIAGGSVIDNNDRPINYTELILLAEPWAIFIDWDCVEPYAIVWDSCYYDCEETEILYDVYYEGEEDDDHCYDECDMEFLMDSFVCLDFMEDEVYEWDGSEVNDIGTFFETAFPIYYSRTKDKCENWIYVGEWVSTANKVGCIDFMWYDPDYCLREDMLSAKDVCEIVGGTFVCEDSDFSCNLGG